MVDQEILSHVTVQKIPLLFAITEVVQLEGVSFDHQVDTSTH